MNNQQQISAGQLVAILLTSRLAVAMTFAPTVHQLSHGTDFLLSILLQALLLALLLLPTWWFARRSEGISTLDYAVAVMGKGGGVVAVFYGLACLYIQAADLIRFSRFASSTLSPGMSREVLCIVLMVTAGIAAFYGIQAIARSAAIIAVFVVATILLAALALLPRMELINFPPLLYDGGSPVLAGALEELPRSMELAVLGLLIPYVKGSLIKGSLWWIGIFTAVALVIQATVVGVLGDFGAMELFPYYTVLTTVQVSVIQRLDIVATAIWVGALFLKMAFFGMLFTDCFQRVTGQKWRMLIAATGAVITLAAGLLLGDAAPLQAEQRIIWYASAVLLGVCAVGIPAALALWDLWRHKTMREKLGPQQEEGA